jgi:hypothetical protein
VAGFKALPPCSRTCSKNHEHSHWQPSHVLSQIFTFQDCLVGAVTALVVWRISPLGEVFMTRVVFGGGLLALFSATMVSHASVMTCQLRYENVVWPNCIKFHTLSGHIVTREGLHHCQTYAAVWFNRCVQEAAERERPRGAYPNCGPGPLLHAGWHCR